jgi:gliding motility-associated-like protein
MALALFFSSVRTFSQSISGIINSYAAVSSVNTTTVCVSSAAGFAVGDKVMIIQMQCASIVTANNNTYGNITAYNNAGKYEFGYIGSISGNCIVLSCPLLNTYSTACGLQLIKVPVYTNATVSNTLTAQAWNGTTGGVLVFEATNLTLNSDINVDGLGFRGGNFSSNGFCCSSNLFVSGTGSGGQKGEGISAWTAGADCSKGKNANGGGGSNCGNGGGGGGGNGGTGGLSGNQYSGCGAGDQAQGGLNLTYPSPAVIYLGGGGGGGFRDNGQICTPGGNGGGIVFIISNNITCNSRIISAKGMDVTTNAVDEGSGGGGAGGSVYISCPTYGGNLTINANGGKGGSNFNSIFPNDCHGPGGGGGGGVYAFSTATQPPTVTFNSPGGIAGLVLNPSSTCFNTSYGATPGTVGITLNNLAMSSATGTVSISGPTTACVGTAVTLTASGASSYTWSPVPANTNTISVTPAATTVYTVMAGAATCSSIATWTVSPVNIPTIGITGNFSVCGGVPTTITANGASSYTWSNGAITAANSVTPASTTVYTVTGANGNCTATAAATVNVNSSPTPTIQSNAPICIGQTLNLQGSGGITYQWNGPGLNTTNQNPSISPAASSNGGTYTLTVTDANNCSGSVTQNIVVNALPIVNTGGSTVCINQTLNLSANGASTYTWTGPGGFFSTSQNPSITNAALSNAGQYTVMVTDANSCTNTAVANAGVNPIPTPNASGNSPVCVNDILTLSASGGLNYSWSGPNGFFSSLSSPTLLVNSVNATGNYNVIVSDAIGCSSSTIVSVAVNALPNPVISANLNKGCAPLCPQFVCMNSTSLASCGFNLGNGEIVNNDTANTCYTHSGTYTITAGVTDVNGCTNTATYTVKVDPVPVADFNFSPVRPVVNGESDVYFTDASHNATITAWSWYFTNTAEFTSTSQNPHFMYEEPGDYLVVLVVKTDKGCMDTIIKSIHIYEDYGLYVPNVFTPNDDGLNDVFQPKGFGIAKYELQIFDRWGELLYTTKEFNQGWDGTRQKKKDVVYGTVAEGVYTWRILVTNVFGDAKELTGHVTLIR